MKNPFVYGTPVIGENFVGRDKEIADIMREFRNRKSIVLFSVRRMGKSSLLLEMSRRHSKDAWFVYVDLYGVTSKNEMLGVIASAVAKATYTKGQKITHAIRDLLRGISARFLITKDGDLAVEFGSRELELLETRQIFDLAEAVGKKRKKRIVVIFDEFQEISSLDGVALLKLMRSRFQMHTNAGSGINSSFAVHQDYSGRAVERALALGIAIGSGYLFKTTFENEVHSDLTGERGVLMGALAGVMEAQYETLRRHGHSPGVSDVARCCPRIVGTIRLDWA